MMVFTIRYSMVLNMPCLCPETWFYHSTYEETLLILFLLVIHTPYPFSLLWLHFYTASEILLMLLLSHSCETTLTKCEFPRSTNHHYFSHLALPRILGRGPRVGGPADMGVECTRQVVGGAEYALETPGSQRTNCTANPRGRREGAWRSQHVSSNCTEPDPPTNLTSADCTVSGSWE